MDYRDCVRDWAHETDMLGFSCFDITLDPEGFSYGPGKVSGKDAERIYQAVVEGAGLLLEGAERYTGDICIDRGLKNTIDTAAASVYMLVDALASDPERDEELVRHLGMVMDHYCNTHARYAENLVEYEKGLSRPLEKPEAWGHVPPKTAGMISRMIRAVESGDFDMINPLRAELGEWAFENPADILNRAIDKYTYRRAAEHTPKSSMEENSSDAA